MYAVIKYGIFPDLFGGRGVCVTAKLLCHVTAVVLTLMPFSSQLWWY